MAFKTSAWFTPEELEDEGPPEELRPAWDRDAAVERGKRERELLKHRLWDEGDCDLGNKLADCGLPLPLVCTCCGNDKSVETACRKRWCPACAWGIQRKRIDRFAGAIKLMKWPAMMTLTQSSSPDPETIRDLRKAFGRFRRRKIFEGKVRGGVSAIEITKGDLGYHPHVHAIIDCEWLSVHTPAPVWNDSFDVRSQKMEHAQHELSSMWADTLGQEHAITWITRMKNLDRLRYALKYAVKGSDLVEMPGRVGELLRVLDRTRCISAFGNLHGRTSEMDSDERPAKACLVCGNEKSFLPVDVVASIVRRDDVEMRMAVPISLTNGFTPLSRYNR